MVSKALTLRPWYLVCAKAVHINFVVRRLVNVDESYVHRRLPHHEIFNISEGTAPLPLPLATRGIV